MKPRLVLALLLGLHCAVACIVPSFDVDSASSETGGTSGSANVDSGGKAAVPATGGTTNTNGAGQAALGGTNEGQGGTRVKPTGGNENASGANASPGGAGDTGGAGGFPGPALVSFSMFHDSASRDSHANAKQPSATFDKPLGTEPGDFMLLFFGADHNLENLADTDLEPQGWTLIDQHEGYGTDGQAMYLAYRFADGTEPDPIVFANINSQLVGVQGLLSVYRGVNRSAPIHKYDFLLVGEGSDGPTHIETPTPELPVTADNCLLIAGLSPDSAIDAPQITAWPDGFDLHPISVTNPRTPYPNGWANIYTAERQLQVAATIPQSAFGWDITYGGTLYYGAISFMLALAPSQ